MDHDDQKLSISLSSSQPRLPDRPTITPPSDYRSQLSGDSRASDEVLDKVPAKFVSGTQSNDMHGNESDGGLPDRTSEFTLSFNAAKHTGFIADSNLFWKAYWKLGREIADPEYLQCAGPSYVIAKRRYDEMHTARESSDPGFSFYLITINPPEGTDYFRLFKCVGKCLAKKWIFQSKVYWVYCIEQRGTTIDGVHGFHAHLALERPSSKPVCHFKREIRNSFSSIVDTEPAINFRGVKLGTERTVIDYVKGRKNDERKIEKVQVDIQWRAQMGLRNYYCSTDEQEEEFEEQEEEKEDESEEGSEEGSDDVNSEADTVDLQM